MRFFLGLHQIVEFLAIYFSRALLNATIVEPTLIINI
jgi:hypothetical protein